MATVNGAGALGLNAGVLKPGCLADIIIADMKKLNFTFSNLTSALIHGACGCNVKTTIVDGRILMENYLITVLDEERTLEASRNAILNITK